MQRRAFFRSFIEHDSGETESGVDRPSADDGLQPLDTPLTKPQAYHLLRRLSFGPKPGMVDGIVGKSAGEAVDMLLDGPEHSVSPPSWVNDMTENPDGADIYTRQQIEGRWRGQFANLQQWWFDRMVLESTRLTEKLTLFWSGHFTSEFTYDLGYIPPQLLFRQNVMLRRNALGRFELMVRDVTLDGAMVVYLGSNLNVRGRPNENYARELLELYTTGLGVYTEGDVQNAAKILTGWKVGMYIDGQQLNGPYESFLLPRDHDTGYKVFMGQEFLPRDTDNNTEFLVRNEEVYKLIEVILRERPEAVSNFIARKMYKFFVYSKPTVDDGGIIAEMAKVFRESGYTIRPLLKALLSSKHFYAEANRGVQIKTPAEYMAGFLRALGHNVTNGASLMNQLEQELIDPPTVAGWDGYRRWISTKTFPNRRKFVDDILISTALSDAKLLTLVRSFPNHTNAGALVDELLQYLLPRTVSNERRAYYLNEALLQRQPDYEWPDMLTQQNGASAAQGLRAFLRAVAKAPDFHLC